jgi:hypothetical protein
MRKKRNGKSDKEIKTLQKPIQNPADSTAVASKITREQMEDEVTLGIQKVTGTSSEPAGNRLLHQVANALVWPNLNPEKPGDAIIVALAFMAELVPKTATETMLATQMIATHEAALMFLRRATSNDQTVEARDANVLRATRLMRLHIDQIESMQKLKGQAGQQRVTVEHVHVHEGGQAIVGAVSAGKTEGVGDDEENR